MRKNESDRRARRGSVAKQRTFSSLSSPRRTPSESNVLIIQPFRRLNSLSDSLAQSHALDKAVALASAQKDFASKLSSHKSTLELKWSKKFQKLQSQYTQQKLSTARDVKQLTTLHASHVRALEKSLNDETIRLEKSRQQIKYLTIQRANESAKYASERERNR